MHDLWVSVHDVWVSVHDLGVSVCDLGVSVHDLGVSVRDLGVSVHDVCLTYVLTEDRDSPWVQSCKRVMYVAAGRGVPSKFPGLHPLSAGAETGAPL